MNNVNQLMIPSIFMVCLNSIFESRAGLNRTVTNIFVTEFVTKTGDRLNDRF